MHNKQMKLKQYENLFYGSIMAPFKMILLKEPPILFSMIEIKVDRSYSHHTRFKINLKYGTYKWTIYKTMLGMLALISYLKLKGANIPINAEGCDRYEKVEKIVRNIFVCLSKQNYTRISREFGICSLSFQGEKRSEGIFRVRVYSRRPGHGYCCILPPLNFSKPRHMFVSVKNGYIAFITEEIEHILLINQYTDVRIKSKFWGKAVTICDLDWIYELSTNDGSYAETLIQDIKELIPSNIIRYGSFAPIRLANINLFVDSKKYFCDLSFMLRKAKREIFIAGWLISPKLYLRKKSKKYRLDYMLSKVARKGVKIYILLYREFEMVLPLNSAYTKKALERLHPNINVLRHSENLFGYWSHHEKIVVIDQKIGYLGGIDLCHGRYDSNKHNLKLNDMPWHDVQVKVEELAAWDLSYHFIERWNMLRQSYSTQYNYILPIDKEYKEGASKVQIIRSVGMWSNNVCTENSIELAYLDLIESSERFIYIENQFFITRSLLNEQLYPINNIGRSLVERIKKAWLNGSSFKVYIIIPLLPVFEVAFKNESNLTELLNIQQKSIRSFIEALNNEGIDYKKYITILSLYKVELQEQIAISQQIYVHSKVIIGDNNKAIIGSANINDRSLLGDRDSEINIIIEDETKINEFVSKLVGEHMNESYDFIDLSSDSFYTKIISRAKRNTDILREAIGYYCEEIKKETKLSEVSKNIMSNIKGHFVLYPLEPMKEEITKNSIFDMRNILPGFIFY